MTENPIPDLNDFNDAINSLVVKIKDIDKKLSSISQEVTTNTKKIKRMETHAQWEENSAFILNPDFNMETIRDDFHLERLHWVRYGRTLKDINDPESPYSKTPNFNSPIDCLAWDIRQGRVIEMS